MERVYSYNPEACTGHDCLHPQTKVCKLTIIFHPAEVSSQNMQYSSNVFECSCSEPREHQNRDILVTSVIHYHCTTAPADSSTSISTLIYKDQCLHVSESTTLFATYEIRTLTVNLHTLYISWIDMNIKVLRQLIRSNYILTYWQFTLWLVSDRFRS